MRTVVLAVGAALLLLPGQRARPPTEWSERELAVLRSLALPVHAVPVRDPSNRYSGRRDAARLGRQLFFDASLSANGRVSCSSCHQPKRNFQDGRKLGRGIGTTKRRTMSLVGASSQTWLFWDGRKDSLWSQALGPLENSAEHGMTRVQLLQVLRRDYRRQYETIFGPQWRVNRAFANLGKAIAAFESHLSLAPARFDRYVRGDRSALTVKEIEGLKLFIGKAGCVACHSGPFFTNGEFHNTGVPQSGADLGRLEGVRLLLSDGFNCLSRFSDAKPRECAIQFLPRPSNKLRGAFKPPSLRNVTRNAPYMHAGQFATLAQVLRHYNRAPRAVVGHSELHPLHFSDRQLEALAAFLATLESPVRVG
jgi:cytochrome c peroxidase